MATSEDFDTDCDLDFSPYPCESSGMCLGKNIGEDSQIELYCCKYPLISVSQALALRATTSTSIFLDKAQAKACLIKFQNQFEQTNFTNCKLDDYMSSNNAACSSRIDDIKNALGSNFSNLLTHCQGLSLFNDSESACIDCENEYMRSWAALLPKNGSNDPHNITCGESLLLTLASTNIHNRDWVKSLFNCLWDVVHNLPIDMRRKHGLRFWLTYGGRLETGTSVKTLLGAFIATVILMTLMGIVAFFVFIKEKRIKVHQMESLPVADGKESFELTKIHEESFETRSTPRGSGLYRFSQRELQKATENFSTANLIGEGSAGKSSNENAYSRHILAIMWTGKVYKGVMPSGQHVAVKHIDKDMKLDTFLREIENLSRVRHSNLVSLLGYCEEEEHYLVYEYCLNGNLSMWLLGEENILNWEQRLAIALGSARGLWFLHNYPSGRVIHRDIKPTNILLDQHLEAKLSDFGLSKFLAIDESQALTDVKGTTGYLDPEYWSNGYLTLASDVYSFGIVLLQLLSGRRVIDLNVINRKSLVKEAKKLSSKGGDVSTFADPRLNGNYSTEAFVSVLRIGVLCTASTKRERPPMHDVLQYLEEAKKVNSSITVPKSPDTVQFKHKNLETTAAQHRDRVDGYGKMYKEYSRNASTIRI
eukprot:Gb_23644 [translate_table: standard]